MPDFRRFVRDQVGPLGLPADREQKIVDEWAVQLEDAYEALRGEGLAADEAWREMQRQVPDWRALRESLLDGEPLWSRWSAGRRDVPAGERAGGVIARLHGWLTAGLGRDLRTGIRLFVKEPGVSATVLLTLAVCLGANAAIFSVVDAVLLRPLPVPESDRIVGMGDVYPTITPNDILSNDVPSYFDRLRALSALEAQAMLTYWYDALTIDGIPREIRGMRVTPSLFRVLRAPTAFGRTFTEDEGEIGSHEKIILSYALWQRLYGGDPGVLGKPLRLGWTGKPYTIVGVMPRGFSFLDRGPDGHGGEAPSVQFWIPLAFTAEQKSDSGRTRYGYFHVGRLRPGATVQQVQAQLDAVRAETAKRFPQFNLDGLGMYSLAVPLQEALTRPVRRTLYLLWGGAAFVLLIGAINVANLALARAARRRRELATRLALGAAPVHLVRQLVVEAMVPALLGGAAGLGAGAAILQWLTSAGLLPGSGDVRIGAPTVGFIAAASVVVGLLVGLAPAVTAGAASLNQVLGDGSRTGTSGRTARLFRRGLVVTQVALSVVLLIAATLLFTSFRHLLGLDAGFTPTGVVTATVFPPPARYPDAASVVTLLEQILDRVRTMPGVEAAGFTSNIALSGFESPASVSRERSEPDQATVIASVVGITPGYFEAMSTPLVRGRYFAATDRAQASAVAIVDEPLAGRLWPGEDPIGKTIYRGGVGPFTVVGIVRNVRLEGLAGSIESIGTAYFPQAQAPPLRRLRWIAIKSSVQPESIVPSFRSTLLDVDRDLPISDVQTMRERVDHAVAPQRLASSLATMFACVALFLSMLGIYGVLANLVASRTREIAIRMALGSSVRGVFQLVLAEGALLIGAGLALGLAGALWTAGTLQGLVFGVQPTNPRLLAAVASGTGCVALLACIAPARRATRVNPVDVLSEP
jgi:predicted permease